MNSDELSKLSELFKQPVKEVRHDKEKKLTIVEFENGQVIPLYGESISLEYNGPRCSHCGRTQIEDTLFTIDEKAFICTKCTVLAVETFLKNNVDLKINIGDLVPKIAENVNSILKNENR